MKKIVLSLMILALTACSQTPPLPGQKLGKPYAVDGKRYYPEYDEHYDKIGMASWYGPGFHGKYTASGEIYNQNDLTAAHPTLPMPSVVRVTNLSNGESIIIRINDRGPFKSNRIIDLSKKSAESIGIKSTTEVRVQFLPQETQEYIASYSDGGIPLTMEAFNARGSQPETEVASAAPDPAPFKEASADMNETVQAAEVTPLVPISSQDLAQPSKPVVNKMRRARRGLLMRDAMADENMPLAAGTYVIQAGAFASQENAHKLGSKLVGIGKLDIDQIAVAGQSLWRVRLGPFQDKSEADGALDKVRAAGQPDAKMVRL